MVKEKSQLEKKPVMTRMSLTLAGMSNLFAWLILIWTFATVPAASLFEYIPLVIVSGILLVINTIAFMLVLVATCRKEPNTNLRKGAYAISLISFPIFYLVMMIML